MGCWFLDINALRPEGSRSVDVDNSSGDVSVSGRAEEDDRIGDIRRRRHHRLDRVRDRADVGEVVPDRERLATGPLDLRGRVLRDGLVRQVGERDVCALTSEAVGQGTAEAAAASGEEHDFAGESEVHAALPRSQNKPDAVAGEPGVELQDDLYVRAAGPAERKAARIIENGLRRAFVEQGPDRRLRI